MTTKRDFLKLSDLSLAEAREVLALSKKMKSEPKGARATLLSGRAVSIIMEKPSTRTRVSFEVGVAQLGGHPVVLTTQGSQLARGEPIFDTARVLARYSDLIVYRTFSQARLEEMARADVPVINALSDDGHPVQVLCDVFTIEEAFARVGDTRGIEGRRIAFVGDCSSNMARSFVEAAVLFNFHLVLSAPRGYYPSEAECARAKSLGLLTLEDDPRAAAEGCDVVNTDVWTSMGQEEENAKRLRDFQGFTLTEAMLAKAKRECIVLHCLPAHRGEEIDDEAIEGPRSRVWDQAENRLHVQKGLMVWLLGLGNAIR
jgi:ornithine carbamoyltransferase